MRKFIFLPLFLLFVTSAFGQKKGTIKVVKEADKFFNENIDTDTLYYPIASQSFITIKYPIYLELDNKDYEVLRFSMSYGETAFTKIVDTNFIEFYFNYRINDKIDTASLLNQIGQGQKYFIYNILIINKKTDKVRYLKNSGVKLITKGIPSNFFFYSYSEFQLLNRTK